MTQAEFCVRLQSQGINFWTGVPCSIFKGMVAYLEKEIDSYVPAVREDTAIGIATGAYLAGKKPIVLMQNSGLGVCLNALTSLVLIYRIPLLLLISWRGHEGKDAPEHLVMGKAMTGILREAGIGYSVLQRAEEDAAVAVALERMQTSRLPQALILKKDVLQ